MRRQAAPAELLLKKQLQRSRIKFRSQIVMSKYIVDFVVIEKLLIVELDGASHENTKDYDSARDEFLQTLGFKIIRIPNAQIFKNLPAII